MIYLDSSATSFLKPPQVAEAVFKSFSTIGNAGRGAHAPTLNSSRLIYDTRDKLAALFGSPDPSRIVFACNATEAVQSLYLQFFSPWDRNSFYNTDNRDDQHSHCG